jgi:hypothetical protein
MAFWERPAPVLADREVLGRRLRSYEAAARPTIRQPPAVPWALTAVGGRPTPRCRWPAVHLFPIMLVAAPSIPPTVGAAKPWRSLAGAFSCGLADNLHQCAVPQSSVGQRVARPLSESSPAGGAVVW